MRLLMFVALCAPLFAADKFEVVAIRPAAPTTSGRDLFSSTGGPGTSSPQRMSFRYVNLNFLATRAYGVDASRITALPDSHFAEAQTKFYDIQATLPAGTAQDQLPGMIRSMLEERFGMRAHTEMQERTVYEMTVAKGGLKLKMQPLDQDPDKAKPFAFNEFSPEGHVLIVRLGTMPWVAGFVGSTLNEPETTVIDKTGMQGWFESKLQFGTAPDHTFPSFRTALEQDWGLHLEKTKAPVDVLVIDHVEVNPTEN